MAENPIQMIPVSEAGRWDSIVRSFRSYDVYSLSGYVKAFALHGDGEPVLFYYESEGLRAYNVVMLRDISADPHFAGRLAPDTWYDLATPYGYGGWLVEGEGVLSALDEAYCEMCRQRRIVSEFVRFHPVWNNAAGLEAVYDVLWLGSTIAMELESPEKIWENIISKNRNMIRKAEKNGVRITVGSEKADYDAFRVMYDATMDKDAADVYYYFGDAFYDSVRKDLAGNALVFTARLEEKPIAAAIILFANGHLNYHLSGSEKEYRNLAPTNLLLHQVALWGSAHGYRTFHLGGGLGSKEDDLFRFKRAFYKGEPKRFAIGRKVFLPEAYAQLNALRQDAPESGFFPGYRRPDARA